ncbi:MAG: YkgJ family cysteine cluster protein [Planctomycetota bacterium]
MIDPPNPAVPDDSPAGPLMKPHEDDTWYHDGLPFRCTQCGNCCTGSPGYVYVKREEIEKIAAFIGREGKGLTKKHIRRVGIRYSLTEDARTGDCCFLRTRDGNRQCAIYPVRPLQCRTWPFWRSNLKTMESWALAAAYCPGMHYGMHHDLAAIVKRRDAKTWKDLEE